MFWDRFYDLCSGKGIKPNTLTKLLGLSSATATNWKKGSIPSGDVLIKIADYFNCSVDYLLGRVDTPNWEIKKAPPESDAQEYGQNINADDISPEDIKELVEWIKSQKSKDL